MAEEKHIVEKEKENIRIISINRPERRNALNWTTIIQLNEAIMKANSDNNVRCVIITGEGEAFCAGLDLKTTPGSDGGPPDPSDRLRTGFHKIIKAISGSKKVYIAMIPGAAAGFGLDIALACDLRYASENAIFAENFIERGLVPDGGGSYHLPRIVGLGKALEMAILGQRLSAEEAKRINLINDVFSKDQFEKKVFEIADKVAKAAPIPAGKIKKAIRTSFEYTLNEALERELRYQLKCLFSEDFVEGITAFLEKRKPVFKGK